MSIRHYNPRRRRRGGISPKARNVLFFFLGLTIALQISYPLIDGEALRLVTIATIYVGALAMVIHGHLYILLRKIGTLLPFLQMVNIKLLVF